MMCVVVYRNTARACTGTMALCITVPTVLAVLMMLMQLIRVHHDPETSDPETPDPETSDLGTLRS